MHKTYRAAPDLAPLLDGSTAGELIPELSRHGLQQLIELEVADVLSADRHEHTEERLGYRNGHSPRILTTQLGDIELQIPKWQASRFLLSIPETHRRVDQALFGVIKEAYISRASSLQVDAALGAQASKSGIYNSLVSRIGQDIDQQVMEYTHES
jgi:putative transposase